MFGKRLQGVRVAILAADGFEQVEVTSPLKALLKAGAEVEVVSLRPGSIQGVNGLASGKTIEVDRTVFTASSESYDALLIPGGLLNPDLLRQSDHALEFVRGFERDGKPIAAICHGPWVLVSAGLARGRRLTSWPGIKDDVRNAGGIWENKSVVVDGNWISSRGPQDLLRFNSAIVEHFDPESIASDRETAVPVAPLAGIVAGGLVAAAFAYAGRQMRTNGSRSSGFEETGTPFRPAEAATSMDSFGECQTGSTLP